MNIWIHSFTRAAGMELEPGLEVIPARARNATRAPTGIHRESLISRCRAAIRRALAPREHTHLDGALHGTR